VSYFKGYVQAAMSSEFTQNIAPHNDGSAAPPETTQDAPEPAPITEQEVGEYREQDRFLPVSVAALPNIVHSTTLLSHSLARD
jgi:hypothetical protein